MRKISKNKKIALLQIFVIPLALLVFWFASSFVFSSLYNGSYTIVSYNHSRLGLTEIPDGRVLKGEKIHGEFKAQYDNLGIVAIRFKQLPRIPWKNEDILIFRLKEKGAKDWYYQNEYYAGLTYDVPNLPIGFPLISNSKGKSYEFEFESTKGNEANGLILSEKNPVLVSRYQMDKTELMNNSSLLLQFFYIRLLNIFNTPDILFSSLIYILPFCLYIAWVTKVLDYILSPLLRMYKDSKLKKIINSLYRKNTILVVFFQIISLCSIIYDIFFLQVLNDFLFFVVIVLWLIMQRISHTPTKITYFISVFLLLFAPIALISDHIAIAEKAGAWAFIFLSGAVFMEVISLRKSKK